MSDDAPLPGDSSQPPSPPPVAEVMAELAALLVRARDAVAAAEDAQRKADSGALRAFQGKTGSEEHSTIIARLKGEVEANVQWFTATRVTVDENAQATANRRREAEDSATAVTASRMQSDADAAAARTATTTASASLAAIEQNCKDVETAQARVTAIATEVTHAKATVDANAAAVKTEQAAVADAATRVKTDAANVASDGERAAALVASLDDITKHTKDTFGEVLNYENSLKKLQEDYQALRMQIESLLPGATSAGLASAFEAQKNRFVWPQRVWLGTFVASVVVLVLVGWSHLHDVNELLKSAGPAGSTAQLTWDLVLRQMTSRSLIVIPLLWLAFVASENYSLALKVQEDYAYKEAMSRSFEGYKKQMEGMSASSPEIVPLLRLCDGVLLTLAERPGRLYDGKRETPTPMSIALGGLRDLVAEVRGLVPRLEALLPKQPEPPTKLGS